MRRKKFMCSAYMQFEEHRETPYLTIPPYLCPFLLPFLSYVSYNF